MVLVFRLLCSDRQNHGDQRDETRLRISLAFLANVAAAEAAEGSARKMAGGCSPIRTIITRRILIMDGLQA